MPVRPHPINSSRKIFINPAVNFQSISWFHATKSLLLRPRREDVPVVRPGVGGDNCGAGAIKSLGCDA